MVLEITQEELKDIEKEGVVLLDFYATWCGPCKMLAPQLENFAALYTNVRVYKIDVDQNQEVTEKFGIQGVPTLALFKDGGLIAQRSGFMPAKQINDWINSTIEWGA